MNKRVIFIYTLFVGCFCVILCRVVWLNFSAYSEAGKERSSRTLTVGETRGKIYDRYYKPLVESEERLLSVVVPSVGSLSFMEKYISDEEIKDKIDKGFPFIIETEEKVNTEFVRTFSVPLRYSENQTAVHIIGYTDKDKKGISGIEKAFDSYLTENSGKLTVTFDCDRTGRILAGMDKRINDMNFTSKAGVVLSIDKDIQKIAEDALAGSGIESGTAIVMKAHTGEILALASYPTYNPERVADALNEANAPLVNKALSAYSPGSVFKPLVAAAALEHGVSPDFSYECTGEIRVGDRVFSCYNHNAHGKINMTEALEESCNTYFVNLAMNTDTELLISLCEKLGITRSVKLASTLISQKGVLPERESLSLKGVLANFSFGQGELLITPIKMAEIYHVLATGNYQPSKLIMGITNYMGLMTPQKDAVPVKLLSDYTVTEIRKMLKSVVENGKADKAYSSLVSLSGKTGTAQSGSYENNKEILRTWFSGFFPSDNPNYIVIVMNENGTGGNTDCAPVFKKICEGIVTR